MLKQAVCRALVNPANGPTHLQCEHLLMLIIQSYMIYLLTALNTGLDFYNDF